MPIELVAIQFNHDPNSAVADALTIRKNQTQVLAVPEWVPGLTLPEQSPAAYACSQGNQLTIKARFRRVNSTVQSVEVFAEKQTGSVLGKVRPATVVFGANDLSDFVLFQLDEVQIASTGVGVWDIGWDWFFRTGSAQPTRIITTKHRIYTLLSLPKPPWGQRGSAFPGFQFPWTEALEQACRWAAGATTPEAVADMITRAVHGLGVSRVQYSPNAGSSHFTIPGFRTFKCTSFLEMLTTGGSRRYVNCTDCATFVSSLTNLLGRDLFQSRMGSNFDTNPIRKIGSSTEGRASFEYHEVAWVFPCTNDQPLFDSSLQVDGDSDPTGGGFSPVLGINTPLGVPTGQDYHFRLAAHTGGGAGCHAMPGTKMQRKIGGITVMMSQIDLEYRKYLINKYNFASWRDLKTSNQNIFLWRYIANNRFSPPGWKRGEIEYFDGEAGTPNITDVNWLLRDKSSRIALRAVTYECTSLVSAHEFLLALLGEFQLPEIERRPYFIVDEERVVIGDLAFAGPKDIVALFARANIVVLMQNEGPQLEPVSSFARHLDVDALTDPQSTGEKLRAMNQFSFPEGKFRVGREIPMKFTGDDEIDKGASYKFFSASGEVSSGKDGLVYRPTEAGDQVIDIYALKTGRMTAWQRLPLSVEPRTDFRDERWK